jgi:hypothetical protein
MRGAMAFSMERVRQFAREITKMIEDLWITTEVFRELLLLHGFSSAMLERIETNAKSDPQRRKGAEERYAAVHKFLEDSAWDAVAEDFRGAPPSSDKPN